jgi:hypothetical protein
VGERGRIICEQNRAREGRWRERSKGRREEEQGREGGKERGGGREEPRNGGEREGGGSEGGSPLAQRALTAARGIAATDGENNVLVTRPYDAAHEARRKALQARLIIFILYYIILYYITRTRLYYITRTRPGARRCRRA